MGWVRREEEERRVVANGWGKHLVISVIFHIVLFCTSAVDFISDVTLGKVPPLLKSAPSPENPCLRSGSLNSACIWELTAETFTQAVMNTNEVVHDVYLHVSYSPHTHACVDTHFVQLTQTGGK